MSFEIENRVSKSPIQSIDLSDFLLNKEFDTFDISDWLKDDLILIEKDFRNHVKSFDWSIYKNKLVSISCSTGAIIPDWAFMLISSELNKLNIKNFIGSVEDFENILMIEAINSIDLSTYKNKPVIIKGCTNKKFKKYFYSLLIDKIQPVAKSIMFGEACSSVPIFKAKK